ncbi:hypothetical protein AJ80_02133 [Polytolypa hystricis UAMH7299]|uniref:Hsp70-like protein n=1 Tax=Polytolypa hystricis (strain UAMH7299) TaxID=1447883 RepID=A0A2B7YIG0_POLH7|nr:hypothetical protein AJ80_02133 [Polytolypa hystricis UAMH7299]
MIGSAALNTMPITFVLTGPADWGAEYQYALRSSARVTGIGSREQDTVIAIDEPEAAALATFDAYHNTARKALFQRNTNVIVVDMGGGTVDIITYKITKISPFQVGEACPGTSAKCGETSIDRELHRLMRERYGQAFQEKRPEKISQSSPFMEAFESVKRIFEGCGPQDRLHYRLPVRMEINHPTYDRGSGEVILTREEIRAMFNVVIDRSLELVMQQIQRAGLENGAPVNIFQLIVLCGGLAGSPCIRYRFNEFYRQGFSGQIETTVPRNAWSAVAEGAALHALREKSLIHSRMSRWSYGVQIHKKYDPERDSNAPIFQCPINGKRAGGFVKWHIKEQRRTKWIDGYVIIKTKGNKDVDGDIELFRSAKPTPGERIESPGIKGGDKFKVKIGQRINCDAGLVEFEAKRGRKKLGEQKFDYEKASSEEDWV